MAKIDQGLKKILDKYNIDYTDKSKLWNCHGTIVLYHKAYEVIAAKENIKFDAPQIIEANTEKSIVSIVVAGHMGDRSEWSFGEASNKNNKNLYPFAMAEKRAKDRVIAKLVGLSEYVYSEEEAEEFKNSKPVNNSEEEAEEKPAQIDPKREWLAESKKLIHTLKSPEEIDKWVRENTSKMSDLSEDQKKWLNNELTIARQRTSQAPYEQAAE